MDSGLIDFSDQLFDQISIWDWYQISNLRERVFVVEQNCRYLDADGKDQNAHHIIGRNNHGKIGAYARIIYPENQKVPMSSLKYLSDQQKVNLVSEIEQLDSDYYMPAIGRVVLDPKLRGQKWGNVLMKYTKACCFKIFKEKPIYISAQKPLHEFYAHHGFTQSGPGYLEDGIPHIPMIYL